MNIYGDKSPLYRAIMHDIHDAEYIIKKSINELNHFYFPYNNEVTSRYHEELEYISRSISSEVNLIETYSDVINQPREIVKDLTKDEFAYEVQMIMLRIHIVNFVRGLMRHFYLFYSDEEYIEKSKQIMDILGELVDFIDQKIPFVNLYDEYGNRYF